MYWLLSTVLRLSAIHDIYIPPRDPAEYAHLKLHHILLSAVRLQPENDALWAQAVEIIKQLPCLDNDNRSVYLRELKKASMDQSDLSAYRYAEAIVNLCYNYACEISICDISKHYNVDELSDPDGDMATFRTDFFSRLSQDWRNGDRAEKRYLADETNLFEEYHGAADCPSLSQAVRLSRYEGEERERNADAAAGVSRYEYELDDQRKTHRRNILAAIGKKILGSFFCIFIACILSLLFEFLQNSAESQSIGNTAGNYGGLLRSLAVTIFFLFFSEIVTTVLTRVFPGLLSLSDALSGMGRLLLDSGKILCCRTSAHVNPNRQKTEAREAPAHGIQIDHILSPEMKAYMKLMNRERKENSRRFGQSGICPIADVNDPAVSRSLIRLEELFHYRFGIAYKSAYNTMLVDPIEGGKSGFYPYERVVPTSGKNGVVMIPAYNGNYILLRQFRHALRSEQLAFPRGYAEPGETPEDTASRELKEELNATITDAPVYLGQITPDSGLTGASAQVYRVEVEAYDPALGHEGITDAVEIPADRLGEWLRAGHTDDGFTLAAYSLINDTENAVHGA